MKILCLVSEFPGHIDFGGMGYLQLVKSLSQYGHDIIWGAPTEHLTNLANNGFEEILFTQTSDLHMLPFVSVDVISEYPEQFNIRIDAIKKLYEKIKSLKPDIILLDRVLQIGLLISEQLEIPCVSVGTPGGYWTKSDLGTQMMESPINTYVEVGEEIKEKLNWSKGSITSLWACSNDLNVCFMGKSFYGETPMMNASYVYHFNKQVVSKKRCDFGVSFGNSGRPDRMIYPLQYLVHIKQLFRSIEIFTGTQKNIYEYVGTHFGNTVKLHKWVTFSDYFHSLQGLAFFGGVGTVWECVNSYVPMLVVSGGVGDQFVNGRAVERLGLGQCINDASNTEEVVEKINVFLKTNSYHDSINEFRRKNNFTDTMDSVVDEITNLIHR